MDNAEMNRIIAEKVMGCRTEVEDGCVWNLDSGSGEPYDPVSIDAQAIAAAETYQDRVGGRLQMDRFEDEWKVWFSGGVRRPGATEQDALLSVAICKALVKAVSDE